MCLLGDAGSNNNKCLSDYCLNLVLLFISMQIVLLLPPVHCVNNTEVLRTKSIGKIKYYASTFLTDQQYSDLLDLITVKFYEGQDPATIQGGLMMTHHPGLHKSEFEHSEKTHQISRKYDDDNVLNTVTTTLSGTQLMQGLQVYNQLTKDLGGSAAMTNIINQLTGVLSNNLGPFLSQTRKRVALLKGRRKGKYACINQMYRMTLQFMTFKRIKTIFSRVKSNLDANTWNVAQKDLGSLINFAMYGL